MIFVATLYGLMRRYVAGSWCKDDTKLDGKTVIVTGANCGIGLETAREMAKRGARVILACRDVDKGKEAAAALRASTRSWTVVFRQLDLASFDSIRKFADEILKEEERIHILINNAGKLSNVCREMLIMNIM